MKQQDYVLGLTTTFGIRVPVLINQEDISLISSIASKTAMKETIAYLAEESFTELLKRNNVEVINAFRKVLSDHEKEMRQAERDKKRNMIKNTELLLVNYRKCKEMVREIDMDKYTDEGTFLASDELTLETLEKYRMKTYKMVRHVEKMLVAYEWECNRGTEDEKRRCAVMKKRYIDDRRMTISEIMEYYHIGQSTVYSDTKRVVKDMASLIFGYDAVMFQ
jgi:hypothetical protein